MARGDTYSCRVCGKIYDYCEKCAITPEPYKGSGFCSEECSHIFNTLSKHGCNLATAEETLAALGNIEGKTLAPSIQAHIDAIKAEIKPAEVKPVEEEPKVTHTPFYTKNNYKKK